MDTHDDPKALLIGEVRRLINYWSSVPEGGAVEDRVAGMAHSLLVLLDGDSGQLPYGFVVTPQGGGADISGELHTALFERGKWAPRPTKPQPIPHEIYALLARLAAWMNDPEADHDLEGSLGWDSFTEAVTKGQYSYATLPEGDSVRECFGRDSTL